MITSFYSRAFGKYTLMKEVIGYWCQSAKVGQFIIVATPFGNYKLKFCGKFKPKTNVKITYDESAETNIQTKE